MFAILINICIFTQNYRPMIKKEIVKNISVRLGIDEDDIRVIVDRFMDEVSKGISSGENVYLRGFGTFILKDRTRKEFFNINTGKNESIGSGKLLSFRPGEKIKENVKKL